MIGILNLNGVETLIICPLGGASRILATLIWQIIYVALCSTVSRPPKLRIHNTFLLYCCCIRPNCVIIPAGTMGEHPASLFEVACPEAVGAIHALQLCCRQGITPIQCVECHIPFSQHCPFAVNGYEEPNIPGFICCLRTGCRNVFRQSVLNQILDTYRCSIPGLPSVDTVVHAINYEVGSSQLLSIPGGDGQGECSIRTDIHIHRGLGHGFGGILGGQNQNHMIGIGIKIRRLQDGRIQLHRGFILRMPLALAQGCFIRPGKLPSGGNGIRQGLASVHGDGGGGFRAIFDIVEGHGTNLALGELGCEGGVLSKDGLLSGKLGDAFFIGVLPALEHLSLRCRHRRQRP